MDSDLDAVIVGAGFAGLYSLHALTRAGYTARVFDAAPEIGGTWYWNRYPGCRCDIESMQYSFQFSEDLQQEWTWSERYASQPEILEYINHVADRFDLRPGIELATRVESARFDGDADQWIVETRPVDGQTGATTVRARFLVLGVGCLSTTHLPPFDGIDDFGGELYHTGRWPQHDVDLSGKRVGVIGTGSSAIQSIPLIAERAEHLYVFQRTPNYVVPAQNRALSEDEVGRIKADYAGFRAQAAARPSAFLFPFNPQSALDATDEDRHAQLERHWEIGGLPFLGAFGDILFDREANRLVTEYWKDKVRAIVHDPAVAETLIPNGDIFGGKRLCAGTGYYETYNRPNVTLVDVSATGEQVGGIERFTSSGLRAAGADYELDVVVCATGFDAMTGSVIRMDITGSAGTTIKERWADGPHNYLGLAVDGFPNLFNLQGPGSPSVFATMVTGIEHQVDWIAQCIEWMDTNGHRRIEPSAEAVEAWVAEVAEVAEPSLRSTCDSWYLGSNIDGKPRVFMPYIGGFPRYVETCQSVVDDGYRGFVFS
jgi:cyclohexanone monooxygenase